MRVAWQGKRGEMVVTLMGAMCGVSVVPPVGFEKRTFFSSRGPNFQTFFGGRIVKKLVLSSRKEL